jgi:hypothetical protein
MVLMADDWCDRPCAECGREQTEADRDACEMLEYELPAPVCTACLYRLMKRQAETDALRLL